MNGAFPRRRFLRTAGLAAAAASGHPGLAALEAENLSEPAFVQLAIATICIDGFGDVNFEPAFEMIPRLGIRNVEFNAWFPRNLTPAGLASIKERCEQRGLKPVCVQGSALGGQGNVVKDVAHKLWCLEAARRLGCRRVKFTGARRGAEGGLGAVVKVLQELAPAAEELGMLVLVENHANNNIETLEDYDRIFAAVPSPNVGMCLDTGHFDGSNIPLDAVVERFHARVYHLDLKDNLRKGVYKVGRFGEGTTDNIGVIEKLLARGYRGYLLLEQAPPFDQATLFEDLSRARDAFRRYERGTAG
jgi:sugar phosphate isomerase/epimerase